MDERRRHMLDLSWMQRGDLRKYIRNAILSRRRWYLRSKTEYIWVTVNSIIALLLILDITYGLFKRFYPFSAAVVNGIEAVLVVIFIVNIMFHLYLCLWPSFEAPFPVLESWKSLLQVPCEGVDSRYWRIVPDRVEDEPYIRHVDLRPTFGFLDSWRLYWWDRIEALGFAEAPYPLPPAERPDPQPVSPRRLTPRESMIRSYGPRIDSTEDLVNYLEDYERERENERIMNQPLRGWRGFTNPGSAEHLVAILQRYRYQQCPKTPSPLDDDPPSQCSQNVWVKQRVSEQMLSVWAERLRKWICQTIVVKLVKEIDGINAKLEEADCAEFKIGEVNLFTLKQVAVMKSDVFPLLLAAIPYLEVALDQEYVFQRLKDLSSGGCMRLYKWNGGGFSAERPWSKDLPYDSSLVMHLFKTYMDTMMPCDSETARKKSFTNHHFKQVPYKPSFEVGKHYIYQSKKDPPHYTVVIDEEVYGLPKGQNNVFCAILLFLHYIKTKKEGVIDRVNLGPSGINIDWVLEW